MLKQSSPGSDTACPPGNIACARNHALQASGANHYRTSGHCSRVVSNEASRPAVNFINMRWICHCPVPCYIQTTLVHGQVMENSIKYIMIKLRKGFFCKKNVAFLLLFLLKKNSKGCCCVNRKFHSSNRKNTLCGKWTLLRLCRGMDVDLLAELLGISSALESRIITSWIHLFSRQVSFLVTWPTMEPIKSQS